MDPKAALTWCDQAISDGDEDLARETLAAYREWRKGHGFEPIEVAGSLMRGDEFADYCERRIVDHFGS